MHNHIKRLEDRRRVSRKKFDVDVVTTENVINVVTKVYRSTVIQKKNWCVRGKVENPTFVSYLRCKVYVNICSKRSKSSNQKIVQRPKKHQ